MPKREDIKKVLVIGSGPIVIGQAAEFDYAGTQACLALKEEGYEVILVNSNPATIMTDTHLADKVYMEPLTVEYLAKVPGLKQVLFFLGKHSANIFMIHTFIRSTYGADLVYGQSHFITVMAVLLVSALLLSMVVELVKKAVHYDAWISRLVARI